MATFMLFSASEKPAMSTTIPDDLAEHAIATLRAHEAELRQAAIHRLSLFDTKSPINLWPSC